MKIEVRREEPIFSYTGCCPEFGQYITLYAEDIRNADVGQQWTCEDQDQYPNRENVWDVTVTLLYKDEEGALIRKTCDEEETELIYIEFGFRN